MEGSVLPGEQRSDCSSVFVYEDFAQVAEGVYEREIGIEKENPRGFEELKALIYSSRKTSVYGVLDEVDGILGGDLSGVVRRIVVDDHHLVMAGQERAKAGSQHMAGVIGDDYRADFR